MRYISDKKLAERWGVHRLTLWRLASKVAGFPQPVKLSPGTTRWKLSDVEAWEIAQEREA
jgi:prophage regulatory protein